MWMIIYFHIENYFFMRTYNFKKLEIKPQGTWISRLLKSEHAKKTVKYATAGAVIGYMLFFFSDAEGSGMYWSDEALSNVIMGLGFGIFLTNSPCARGKC